MPYSLLRVIACIGASAFHSIGAAQPAQPDPVAAFEAIVAPCAQAHEVPRYSVFFQKSANAWMKRVDLPSPIKYDVRRTDSLLTPVVGFIESTTRGTAVRAATEQQAQELIPNPDEKDLDRRVTRFNYAFRSGVWVLTGATASLVYHPAEKPLSMSFTLESIRNEGLPWSACVGVAPPGVLSAR